VAVANTVTREVSKVVVLKVSNTVVVLLVVRVFLEVSKVVKNPADAP
jgi:hypothetical protein